MYRMGNQISFHEPHCSNYRLFVASPTMQDNPFAVKIEQIDSMVLSELLDPENDDADNVSAQSALLN